GCSVRHGRAPYPVPLCTSLLGLKLATHARIKQLDYHSSNRWRALGITVVGTRQHLAKLHAEGLVAFDDHAGEIGRPKRVWRLTAKGHGRFPDTHGDLTVNLIGGIRELFGEAGWTA